MITQEQKTKVTQAVANNTFQSLNFNGLLLAAKYYSVNLAKEKIESMADEELTKLLADVEAAEQRASEDGLGAEPVSVDPNAQGSTTVNPEAQ
jgi:hypothetical protein